MVTGAVPTTDQQPAKGNCQFKQGNDCVQTSKSLGENGYRILEDFVMQEAPSLNDVSKLLGPKLECVRHNQKQAQARQRSLLVCLLFTRICNSLSTGPRSAGYHADASHWSPAVAKWRLHAGKRSCQSSRISQTSLTQQSW